jgi:hypothetical protein
MLTKNEKEIILAALSEATLGCLEYGGPHKVDFKAFGGLLARLEGRWDLEAPDRPPALEA